MRGEFVDLHGQRLYYYAAGTRGLGIPLLLLAGPPFGAALWEPMLRSLPVGHRTVVVDSLGCGRSDPPTAEQRSPAAHASVLCDLLKQFGIDRIAIATHGTGAAIAFEMLAQHPGCIDRVAFIAPITDGRFVGETASRLGRMLPAPLAQAALTRAVADAWADPLRGARAAAAFVRVGASRWAEHAGAFAQPLVTAAEAPPHPLVIVGDGDPLVPVDLAEAFAARIAAPCVRVAGGRHALPDEFPLGLAAPLTTWLTS